MTRGKSTVAENVENGDTSPTPTPLLLTTSVYFGGETHHSGYECAFRERMVRIGRPLGSPTGESLVFRLHEYGGKDIPFCIRFTPTARVWKKEETGLVTQELAASGCVHVLEVYAYGMYSFDDTEEGLKDNAPPHPFDSVVLGRRGLYAILPLCAGGDLFDLMADRTAMGKMVASDVADITRSLIRSLGGLRAKGIVHGDIKPENMCFRRRCADTGVPHLTTFALIDFGFATVLARDCEGVPHCSGTYPYLSPEVYVNIKHGRRLLCSPAVDMFSAGVTLFLLCNERLGVHHGAGCAYPGQGTYDAYVGNMNKHRPDDRDEAYVTMRKKLATYDTQFPRDLEGRTVVAILRRVVSKMTAYHASERPTPNEASTLLDFAVLPPGSFAGVIATAPAKKRRVDGKLARRSATVAGCSGGGGVPKKMRIRAPGQHVGLK